MTDKEANDKRLIAAEIMPVCGIKHGFGDQTCIRQAGHDGFCRCKAGPTTGGTITYSEWESRDGKFYSHVGYKTIYPANRAESDSFSS